MRRLGLACVLAGLASGPALAADPVAALPEEPLEATQINPEGWSGFHIGALLGYSAGEADAGGVAGIDTGGMDGGVYAGVDTQIDRFVLGAEADILASDLEGEAGGVSVRQDWSGSLRGRAGIALDDFLLYGTGGLAAAGVEASAGGFSDSDTRLGWTVGAGVEAKLSESLTARIEYRYTDLENKVFELDRPRDVDLGTSSIRAGIGVRF